jgi:peptide/nickel transport system substrate-binding protein
LAAAPVLAQKSGGVLKVHHQDSPASMSIIEEATYSTVVPMMGVFNNLVMYKQDEPQNSMKSIVPDLATSWSWSEDGSRTWRLALEADIVMSPVNGRAGDRRDPVF